MSRPSKKIDPPMGSTTPDTAFSSVDLPAPFVPSRATHSPGADVEVDAEEHLHLVVGDLDAAAGEQRALAAR